jgi:hypothetical protein
MVMRPSDLEIASQSAFRNFSVPLNSQQLVTPERAKTDQPSTSAIPALARRSEKSQRRLLLGNSFS